MNDYSWERNYLLNLLAEKNRARTQSYNPHLEDEIDQILKCLSKEE